jgi:hypothetical protein
MAVALSLVLCATLAAARAGLLDTPPPVFPGGVAGKVVYRMGAIHYDPGHVDTVITCTNVSERTVPIAVELFDQGDQRSGIVIKSALPARATVVFATSPTAEFPAALVFPNLAPIDHGKARVSATTSRLTCDGDRVIRATEDTAPRIVAVELIKKVSYDGD